MPPKSCSHILIGLIGAGAGAGARTGVGAGTGVGHYDHAWNHLRSPCLHPGMFSRSVHGGVNEDSQTFPRRPGCPHTNAPDEATDLHKFTHQSDNQHLIHHCL